MSLIDDIQSILNLHEEYKSKSRNWEFPASRPLGLSLEQENRILLDEYETIKNILQRTTHLLINVQEEFEESKLKNQQAETQLDLNKNGMHTLQEEIEKLQEKVAYLEQEEENLKDENIHMQQLLTEKQKQNELKQEANVQNSAHFKEESTLLNQYIENVCLKYKNLEIIAEKEAKHREKLEEESSLYQKQEKQLIATLNDLTIKLSEETHKKSLLEREIEEKQTRIHELEAVVYHNTEELQMELNEYELYERKSKEQELNLEVPHELKLLQLSEQISYNEKLCVNLNFSDHSFEGSNNEPKSNPRPKATLEKFNQILQKMDQSPEGGHNLRKVASSAELSSRKKINSDQIEADAFKQSQILKELGNAQRQSATSKEITNNSLNQITNRAQNRLKNFYQLNSDKIIIETQVTERQCETDRSCIPSESQSSKHQFRMSQLADPYYIHYLLTVQSVKIEEDEEGLFGILQVDMKPFYEELIRSKLSLSKWSEWIRSKLITLSNEEQF